MNGINLHLKTRVKYPFNPLLDHSLGQRVSNNREPQKVLNDILDSIQHSQVLYSDPESTSKGFKRPVFVCNLGLLSEVSLSSGLKEVCMPSLAFGFIIYVLHFVGVSDTLSITYFKFQEIELP